MFTKYRLLALTMVMAIVTVIAIAACSPAEPQVITEQVEVTRVVTEEVVKEVEVEKEVVKEVEVEKEVIKEVEVVKEVEVMAPEGPKEAIIFGDLNWSSALLQNRIAQYIVEKGYGYPTDVKFGATLPLFQGLKNGDTDVTMEIWLPNQDEAWNEAREEGAVLSVGQSLGKDWQSAFVIPAYLQEQYPDLDSVDDLQDQQYKDLFKTAESGDKARLVSCIIGWACETVNAAQIEGYGLNDHVHIVNPGDGAALNADLYGAYEREEPWLGYQWGTNDPALKLDLVRLEEPAYSDECWFTTKACAYEDATILIAVNPDLPGRAPDVVGMLRNWDFNINIYKAVVRWQGDNPDASVNDTALWWLNNNADVWSGWVTDEAAEGIQAALSAGEEADGWPTE
ncbi:MAG: ABC transporter substrate-binding protein [Chloroflexota bacterium]|nr:ABC transporter substrate-binding protein [Chloroflexota bacterium]